MIKPEVIAETVRRITAGEPMERIANDHRIPPETLYTAFRKNTGKKISEINPLFAQIRERHEHALSMMREGASMTKAARSVGITKQAISQWLKRRRTTLPEPVLEGSARMAKVMMRFPEVAN